MADEMLAMCMFFGFLNNCEAHCNCVLDKCLCLDAWMVINTGRNFICILDPGSLTDPQTSEDLIVARPAVPSLLYHRNSPVG